ETGATQTSNPPYFSGLGTGTGPSASQPVWPVKPQFRIYIARLQANPPPGRVARTPPPSCQCTVAGRCGKIYLKITERPQNPPIITLL
ncbi:unnamed protein product, partial [Anisakis simplex]|uniref:Uncharacterized protein n=1 Tax=Anisakis simplex TaxID=6269 RepID=A0A0M3J3E6_ANISI